MNQGWQTMGTIKLIDESEVERTSKRRSRNHGQLFGGFLSRVRRVIAFLLVATVLVFAFCYSTDLQNVIVTKLYKWSQAELKASTLRQSALNHENEVNQVAK